MRMPCERRWKNEDVRMMRVEMEEHIIQRRKEWLE